MTDAEKLGVNELVSKLNIKEDEIVELQKEIAELKDKLNNLESVAEVRLANWQKYEKENAELEAENEANENGAKKYAEFYFETNNKLTEAKELLTRFIMASIYFNGKEVDLVEQTEKFLKNV